MTQSILSKIIINKFGEYHGEINLKNCTILNCIYLSAKECNDLAKIMKFMFSNEDALSDIEDILEHNDDQGNSPFIEIHIKNSQSNDICVMRKSIQDGSIIYEINNLLTFAKDFKNKLHEYGYLFSFTWYITQETIESLMKLNGTTRVDLIESLCQNLDLKKLYNQHKTKMNDLEIGMKYLNDMKKEFFMEKKIEKTRAENSTKIMRSVNDYETKVKHLTLLKLYKNEKTIEELPDKCRELDEDLERAKISYTEALDAIKENSKGRYKTEAEIFKKMSKLNKMFRKYESHKRSLNFHEKFHTPEEEDEFNVKAEMMIQKINDELRKAEGKLKDGQGTYDKYHATMEEYKTLKTEFIYQHSEYSLFEMLKIHIDRQESIKKQLEVYKSRLHGIDCEQSVYIEETEKLSQKEQKIQQKLNEIDMKLRKDEKEVSNSLKYIKDAEKWINDKVSSNNSDEIIQIKIIEQKLREKFPRAIIGILSELFDVGDFAGISVKKSQILECLGNSSNAIIVESNDDLTEITNYLKLLQCDKMKVKLIPQRFYKISRSLNNLRDSVAANVKIESIEKFLRPISNEIMKILMEILGPTAVCDCKTPKDVKNVFISLGKLVKVVSFAAGCMYLPDNQIRMMSVDEVNFENLEEVINNLIEKKKSLKDMLFNLEICKHKHSVYFNKIRELKIVTKLISESRHRNAEFQKILSGKIRACEKYLTDSDNEESQKIQQAFNNDLLKFGSLLEAHYREFCVKNGFESFHKYQDLMEGFLIRKRASLDVVMLTDKKRQFSKYLAENRTRVNRESNVLSGNEFEAFQAETFQFYQTWKNHVLELAENYKYLNAKKNEFESILLSRHAKTHQSKLLRIENYQILHKKVLNFEKVPLVAGSLFSILNVPSMNDTNCEIDEFLMHELDRLTLKYDVLSDATRNSPDTAICELEDAVDSLKNTLKNYPLSVENNEAELQSINEKINFLSTEIYETNSECQKVLAASRSVIAERKTKFFECFNAINVEIRKYCDVMSIAHAQLMESNENEPYLDEIQYLWQSNNRMEYVEGANGNWQAALAFLVGILSYKKQNFLPYFELSSELPILEKLIKYSSNDSTKLQSVVFSKARINESRCSYTIMRFNGKLHILSCEELKKMLEDF